MTSDISREPPTNLSVAILGAGLSGLAMGIALRKVGFDDFVIYEKQPDVGGTWLRNTYPGLACDIASHLYSYSFEPNPNWSKTFAGQAEIQAYLRACAEKYQLIDQIRFDTDVASAHWRDDTSTWEFDLGDAVVQHRVLVAATGGLTEPNLPRIEGLDRFAGAMWHSAAWRHDIDLDGAAVAVVGSAASAVQVVPEVAKRAAALTVYSRTPNWVLPRGNVPYSEAERRALADPDAHRRLWLRQYRDSMLWWGAFNRSDRVTDIIRERCRTQMRAAIDDPELIAALTPTYDPGCKRILSSDDYYPALAQDHVRLVPEGVQALTETGVVDASGNETPVDVVIFCTGYRLGGRADGSPAVEVYGKDGLRLRDAIRARPESYRGVATPGFPNYFTVVGINGAVGYGPVYLAAELHAEFIARWVRRMADDALDVVEVRADVTHALSDGFQRELQAMSWAGDCPNFYRDPTGRILAFYPGTVGRMRRDLRDADPDDFIVR